MLASLIGLAPQRLDVDALNLREVLSARPAQLQHLGGELVELNRHRLER